MNPRSPIPIRRVRAVAVAVVVALTLGAAVVGPAGAAPVPADADPTWGTSRPALPADSPVAAAEGVDTGAGASRRIGDDTLNAVLAAAEAKKACGLGRDQLAAMMLAPIYPETGAGTTTTPSPMTLSRYDTQAGLYAFGNASTPYQRAFFHPGIGLWQFDSAGGWNLTGAQAISSTTSAQQAATVMASRWCTNPTRSYAWGPWYGCATTSTCEDIYNAIFDGNQLVNLTIDASVSGDGGMVWRTCGFLNGPATVPCAYVDPSKAQGNNGWAQPGAGPAPIAAPFYVIAVGSTEYRYWLSADTGYPTIVGSKPITGNARTTLTWATRDDLCDLSLARGNCSHSPFGSFDAVTAGASSVSVRGWTIDPDTNAAISVGVWIDGSPSVTLPANGSRPDVGGAYPAFGPNHGFDAVINGVGPGGHTICVYALNVGAGTENTTLGCKSVSVVQGDPVGSFDAVYGAAGRVLVRGWAIDPDVTTAVTVAVWVDGAPRATALAAGNRPDLGAAYAAFGISHGFDASFGGVAPGSHSVCVYAINVGAGTENTTLGCRTVVVASGAAIGSFDLASAGYGTLRIAGWGLDPDTTAPVQIHVYRDGQPNGTVLVAGGPRPDVGSAFPIHGQNHAFDAVLSPMGGGNHTVCAFVIDATGDANSPLGCRSVVNDGTPVGALDQVNVDPGSVFLRGWTLDADTTAALAVHVYLDDRFLGAGTADQLRGDIAAIFPAYGGLHGFGFRLSGVAGGSHRVCAYGIGVAVGDNVTLGCNVFTATADPFGSLDLVAIQDGHLKVRGWAIDPDTNAALQVHVYVDGVGHVLIADRNRPDVGAVYPVYNAMHGFDADLGALAPGGHTVCAFAINAGTGSNNPQLGCRNV